MTLKYGVRSASNGTDGTRDSVHEYDDEKKSKYYGRSLSGGLLDAVRRRYWSSEKKPAPEKKDPGNTHVGLPWIEGYLRKENRYGRWQRRFFSLHNSNLNYYKDRASFTRDPIGSISGSIDLSHATSICIMTRNGLSGRIFAIQTTRMGDVAPFQECFFFRSSSSTDSNTWVRILNQRRDCFITSASRTETLSLPDANEFFNNEAHDKFEDRWWKDDENDDGFVTGDEASDSETLSNQNNGLLLRHSRQRIRKASSVTWRSIRLHDSFTKNFAIMEKICTIPAQSFKMEHWAEPDVSKLMVRSASYLYDRKKEPASDPLFRLFAMDIYQTSERVDHIAQCENNRVAQALKRRDKFPFTWVVVFQIPGPPFYSCVCYFAATLDMMDILFDSKRTNDAKAKFPHGFQAMARRFFLEKGEEHDAYRDRTYKIVARIVEGPRVVRMAVPSKPALVGKKLKHRYFLTERYMELDLDIGASSVAWKITQFALGYVKLLTVDIAMLLEGTKETELPEQVLGMSRWIKVDFREAPKFETSRVDN